MTTYKAILTDVDDTLLSGDLQALPTRKVKNAILASQKKGIIVSLVTARPLKFLHHLFEDLQLHGSVILDNGARIFDIDTQQPLWESILPQQTAKTVFKLAKKFNKKVGVASKMDSIPDLQKVTDDLRIRKFNIKNCEKSEAVELKKLIEKENLKLYIVIVPSNEVKGLFNVMVNDAEATKQHAVLKLADLLGIKTQEIIGIGDHYNDFTFIMACGLKVAMGNASEELKAVADYICASVSDDGVADVIQRFILDGSHLAKRQ